MVIIVVVIVIILGFGEEKMTKAKNIKMQFQSLTTNFVGMVRNEILEGRDYLVVPMIMIVEGVLNGTNGPLYYPAEELAKVPSVWNMKPVVVYHPTMNGKALSACDPDVIEKYKVGMIMNTIFDGKRLKAEAWLEPDRLAKVDQRVQNALDTGEMSEVSTGLHTENEAVEGSFGGVSYGAIARNLRPDHLAILPDQIGACSISDGAGLLRTNSVEQRSEMNRILNKLGINAEQSHEEIRKALYIASALLHSDDEDFWIDVVYYDSFIYERDGKLFQQIYKMVDENAKLEGVPFEVEREVTYEKVKLVGNRKKGDIEMDKKEIVDGLIANSKWEEEDRETLMSLSEDQLGKIEIVQNAEVPEGTVPSEEGETVVNEDDEDGGVKPIVNSAEDYLAAMPPELREVHNEALNTHAEKRAELSATIMAHKRNILTSEHLAELNMNELKAMAVLAKDVKEDVNRPNYSGQAPVGNVGADNKTEEPLLAPVMNFSEKK